MIKKQIETVKDFFQVFKWCISLSWRVSKSYTSIRIFSQMLLPMLGMILAYTGKLMIDILSSPSGSASSERILMILIFVGVLALLRVGAIKLQIFAQLMQSEKIEYTMVKKMMDFSLDVDLEYFDDPKYQDKINTATRDGLILAQALGASISVISSSVSLLTAFIIVTNVNVWYAVIMIMASIPSGVASKYYTEALYDLSLEQTLKRRRLAYIQSLAYDTRYSQDLRLFMSCRVLKDKYSLIWNDLFSHRKKVLVRKSQITFIFDFLPEFVLLFLTGKVVFSIFRGELVIGDYVFITGLLTQLWSSTSGFINASMEIVENKLRMKNYRSLFTYINTVLDSGVEELSNIESIEFRKVCFKYPRSKKYALKDVSFVIKSPERVAFVGLNGSGKSTLIKLLLRFYEPTDGEILINNRSLANFDLSSLRSKFRVYFQDMQNFAFDIETNFILTYPSADFDRISAAEAVGYSGLEREIRSAEKGYSTEITKYFSPDGLILSGGQVQKFALARTLYRKAEVLVLDEVSSNLDPEAEYQIFKNLDEITHGKLTIFTSHRLSNLSLADRIIVLEEGCLIEDGTPLELLKNNNRYAELFRYQQEKYMTEDLKK